MGIFMPAWDDSKIREIERSYEKEIRRVMDQKTKIAGIELEEDGGLRILQVSRLVETPNGLYIRVR